MLTDADEQTFEQAVDLQRAGRLDEAISIYLEIAKTCVTVNLARNLGAVFGEVGCREEAEHWLGLAARNRPGDINLHRLLGGAFATSGKIQLAEQEFRSALAAKPGDVASELALAGLYLSVGRYAEGWPLMEGRMRLRPDLVPAVNLSFPEWRGEPLTDRSVLVWLEQGLGDQIQMSRFVNSLKAQGAARVSLGCRPSLAHLFTTLAGADAIVAIAAGERTTVGDHDYWSRYFSLPEHLAITLGTLPTEPYLAAPADRRARWRGSVGAKVGVCWRASPTGTNGFNKSLPIEQARRLLDRGAMSLHPEDTGAADFADTAAIIEQLDLVISIDTSVAHLAGALGKPCWTLIPYINADWRWLRERDDSPWYPTMKLYRQDIPRDWSTLVDAVLNDWPA